MQSLRRHLPALTRTLFTVVAVPFLFLSCDARREVVSIDINDVKSGLEEVKTAVEHLRSEVDDFSYSDWREVVPEVETRTSELESELSELESAIEELEQNLQSAECFEPE